MTAYALEVAREVAVHEEAERTAVEVARVAQAFPYAPQAWTGCCGKCGRSRPGRTRRR